MVSTAASVWLTSRSSSNQRASSSSQFTVFCGLTGGWSPGGGFLSAFDDDEMDIASNATAVALRKGIRDPLSVADVNRPTGSV